MAAKTEAQQEFDDLISKTNKVTISTHPEDAHYAAQEEREEDSEETEFQNRNIDDAMRMPVFDRMRGNGTGLLGIGDSKQFDGARTGVKGVIADARSYQMARKENGHIRSRSASRVASSKMLQLQQQHDGLTDRQRKGLTFLDMDGESDEDGLLDEDDDEFLEQWREARRLEIQRQVVDGDGKDVRNRRTSPSGRRYGRWDEVDALGYLDAIEKVGRDTTVVVFVYDDECPVSQIISRALRPLAAQYPSIHFVKVSYDEIEFDNAGVPAVLAYRNQGDLFANLTYIVDQIPEGVDFDTDAVKDVFRKQGIIR